VKPSFLRYSVLRPWLWRWHRRTGLAAAIILVLVTVTGVFLNHTSELSLQKKFVGQAWLLSLYGIPEPELVSFELADTSITGDEKGQLYRGVTSLASCRGGLVGASVYAAGFIVACQQELLFFDEQGRLAEKVSAIYGLPTPVEQLGKCAETLCIRTPKRMFELDIEQLSFVPVAGVRPVWSEPIQLLGPVREAIYAASREQGLSWERVMLDVHSGRLFGTLGVWVVDAAAIVLLFLALSGFVLWFQHMSVKRTRSNAAPDHEKH
jgi:hypothetical protein